LTCFSFASRSLIVVKNSPVGMVSAGYTPNKYSDARTGAGLLRVGATTCEWCPPGTYPDYDKAHCVNGGGIVALIVIVQLLFVFVDVVLWSPLNPKPAVDIGGAMRPTGAIFSVLWFIITIICVSAGNMSAPATAACAVIGFGGLFVIPCIFKSLESLAAHDKDMDNVTNAVPSASDNAKTALPDAPPAYPEQVLNPAAHAVDPAARGDGSSTFVRNGFATKHTADMQPDVNYQTARAVIQYMDYGAVDGGSCEKW
jgi:hypothetical protein